MKYCPHEIFSEQEIAKKFPQIKIAWESTQRQHHLESKIHNPTEQNQEDLETWQKNSRDLEEYIKNYEKFNFKLLKFLKPKKNIIIGAGIGLFTSLGTFKIKDNLFRKKSTEKKIPLLQKAFILSGFTILGGIGGKYFYQMKTIFNKN